MTGFPTFDSQKVEELAQLLYALFGTELDKERFRVAAVEVLEFLHEWEHGV